MKICIAAVLTELLELDTEDLELELELELLLELELDAATELLELDELLVDVAGS